MRESLSCLGCECEVHPPLYGQIAREVLIACVRTRGTDGLRPSRKENSSRR
jgi:hypothetical protein